MSKLLVILGATTTGKTDLALNLANKYQGELVACDSRQIYMGLDLGTGKFPGKKVRVVRGDRYWEMDGIKVWMYDEVSPKIQYTVADYVKDAKKVIGGIRQRGKLPIIVGGTGLYLKALLEGLPNLAIPVDHTLRKSLEKLTTQQLQEKLKSLSPSRWKKLNQSDRANPRRLLRSLELVSMYPYMRTKREMNGLSWEYDISKIGLTAPRDVLYKYVDARVISRLDQGMVEEANRLHQKGLSFERMRQLGLEYEVLANYLDGKVSNLVASLEHAIHGYIRRQQTWFKKEKEVHWFNITSSDWMVQVEKLVERWYHQPHAKKN